MSEHEVRALSPSEFRQAHDLFLRALHLPPSTDERWVQTATRFEQGRVLGAFARGELCGTARSTAGSLTVPGGETIGAAEVTGVAVRADRTRRGLLTALMRRQLHGARELGEPVAVLRATEAVIYERFGYGVATRARTVEIDRRRTRMRDSAPGGGEVRMVVPQESAELFDRIYHRTRTDRPGAVTRNAAWWRGREAVLGDRALAVVRTAEDGTDDGFAVYEPGSGDGLGWEHQLRVHDLRAASPAAAADLWRFLLGMDLTGLVTGYGRPLDEPLEWWLTDRRQCRTRQVGDDLWLRLIDVGAALRARSYPAGLSVALEVEDAFLPDNSGCYRIGEHGVERWTGPAQLSLPVEALAALYLGDQAMSALAAAGRVTVYEPAAIPVADRLFAAGQVPWCGTDF
ncbi:GNAT family N-acetyltransferase [Saccharopolyspora sp. HNM0983]|uniref:GNAT family N-acetyltransferase n=1 Tax=Saccharopolyspora montiporae TaxID=2781240 RepID=A0A929G1A4_9PSEU|nr:GNAT family N-acetyltransferase [Saccharopolyspora sp. HNM0983]